MWQIYYYWCEIFLLHAISTNVYCCELEGPSLPFVQHWAGFYSLHLCLCLCVKVIEIIWVPSQWHLICRKFKCMSDNCYALIFHLYISRTSQNQMLLGLVQWVYVFCGSFRVFSFLFFKSQTIFPHEAKL